MPGRPVARRFSCHRARARINQKRLKHHIRQDNGHLRGTLWKHRNRLCGPLVEEQYAAVAFAERDVTVDAGVTTKVRVNDSDVVALIPVVVVTIQVDVNGRKRQACENSRGAKDRDNTAKHRRHYLWLRRVRSNIGRKQMALEALLPMDSA